MFNEEDAVPRVNQYFIKWINGGINVLELKIYENWKDLC